ncbi:MAG: sulfatase-like hydrolase/transferase [Ilumatobacteraceae bacterium]|nr:sulfatase-like hydrolase/transferase [Ilumatobacteraceae bacterium]
MMVSKRPNVLLVMTDEHHAQVSGYAGDPVVETGCLDRLASRSVAFDRATCAGPVCTPSRMSMLTGREPHRCAGWSNHWVIFPERVTWPAHFAEHGYRTALIGKMHFGGRDQMQGFQSRPYGDLRHGLGHQPDPLSMFPGYAHTASAGTTEVPVSMLQDVVVSRETREFIVEHADTTPEQPWFVCASYSRPHAPLTTPGRYQRRYSGRVPAAAGTSADGLIEQFARNRVHAVSEAQSLRAREAYYACVDFVDDCIAELIEPLERDGLLDDTIVIYTSDHGEMLGLHSVWGKQLYHQASVGVPLLISGPGLPAGTGRSDPISLIDLFPTTCGLVGLPIPSDVDGTDLSGSLLGDANAPTRQYTASAAYRYGIRIAHDATEESAPHEAWRCVQDGEWKYVEVERGARLLFNFVDDPCETDNLVDQPEHGERVERMRGWLYESFGWEDVHEQLRSDRDRVPDHLSGLQPSTPNQYMLPDGRTFDAEGGLYGARWLPIPEGADAGIIPQQFG